MQTFRRIVLIFLAFVALERLTRLPTDGFRLAKTRFDYTPRPDWEGPDNGPVPKILHQPFTFLGSGVQCYTFLSGDQSTVLKLFKHYHAGLSSRELQNIPLPTCLRTACRKILQKRQKRIEDIFSSALLARNALQEQTGVVYLNINPQQGRYPTLTLYDKIGVQHRVDLNTTPFALQKRADRFFDYLEHHPQKARDIIDSFFHCIVHRRQMGIANSDPKLSSNFGIVDGQVVELDIGSFVQSAPARPAPCHKWEMSPEILEFKRWLQKNQPQMHAYFEEKLDQAIHI